jgi:hypothetical protein
MESYLQFKRSSMRLEESSIHDPSSRLPNNQVFIFSQSPGDSIQETQKEEESENENIEESEDQEEKTLSRQRKLRLMQNN